MNSPRRSPSQTAHADSGFRYQQVADELRQMLRDGLYNPGDQLPTERDLAQRFKVAHLTIRRAHQELESEGVIRRERGRGTFVCGTPAPRRARDSARVGYFSVDSALNREHLRTIREGLETQDCSFFMDVIDQIDVIKRLPEVIQREQFDLVILDGQIDHGWLRTLPGLPCPVLICGTVPATPGVAMVTPDMERLAFDLTRLLREQLRFDHIWLVLEPLRLYYDQLVMAGYRRAIQDASGPASPELLVLCDDDRWDPFTRQFSLLQPQLPGRHAVIWMYRYPFVPPNHLPPRATERLGVVNYTSRDPGWFLPKEADLGSLRAPEPEYGQTILKLALEMVHDPTVREPGKIIRPHLSIQTKGGHPRVHLDWHT